MQLTDRSVVGQHSGRFEARVNAISFIAANEIERRGGRTGWERGTGRKRAAAAAKDEEEEEEEEFHLLVDSLTRCARARATTFEIRYPKCRSRVYKFFSILFGRRVLLFLRPIREIAPVQRNYDVMQQPGDYVT